MANKRMSARRAILGASVQRFQRYAASPQLRRRTPNKRCRVEDYVCSAKHVARQRVLYKMAAPRRSDEHVRRHMFMPRSQTAFECCR